MEKPQIKTITIFQQFEPEGEKFLHFKRTFDEKGNKLSEISYSPEEEIIEENTYAYDASGKLLEEKNHFISDEVIQIQHYEYDENGRLIKKHKKYGEEGDEDSTGYTYSESGNLLEKRTLSPEGELEHLETWKYEADKLIEAQVKNYDGSIMESAKFSYNEKGELKEEIRYTSETEQEIKILYDFILPDASPDTTLYSKEGKIIQRTRHTFDEKKHLVKEVIETVSNGVQKFTTEFFYDQQDNKIESKLVDKNENLISKIVYKHDPNQLQIEEIHFEKDVDGEITLHTGLFTEYEFFN